MNLSELNKNRTYLVDISEKDDGKKLIVAGWIYDDRDLGKVRFIILRDITGEIQITGIKKETKEEVFSQMTKIPRESVVIISGIVRKNNKAPGGREINPETIEVLATAEHPLPIDVSDYSKTELSKRLDYRFLDLHRRKIQAIFKVQSTIMQTYREFMIKEGAIEAQFPSIIRSSSEGGTELFTAQYFEKKAYLSQSCQLYKQMLACSMEKVFAIFTVWRAEKHNTIKHLNESRQLDFEMAFADEFIVMDVLGRCIQYIIGEVIKKNKNELNLLDVKIKVPSVKYLKFAEVAEIMKKNNVQMGEDDLNGEVEKELDRLYPDTIVFVHDWPISGKPFYIMPKNESSSCGFDAIYKGMEISSGGQRIHIPDLLIKRLKAKGLNPKDFKAYIDSFRYGAPPHGGFGVGLERLTMLILGLNNIREATLFPRDRDRLSP